MKVLDRYIIRSFLINFVILLVVLMGMYLLIDLVSNLDDFLEAGREHADRFGGTALATLWAIFDFQGPMLLLVYVFISGIVIVGAMGFTFAGLTRTGEINAMVTSGLSMYRLMMPVLAIGAVLNFLAIPIQEYMIPPLASKIARTKGQIGQTDVRNLNFTYAPDAQGNLFSAAQFDLERGELRHVDILLRTPQREVSMRITAEQALWDADRDGWALIQGHGVRPWREDDDPHAAAVGPVPYDFIATDLSPEVIMARRAKVYPRLLSLRTLTSLARADEQQSMNFRQIMYSRFSMLVVNMLILVMGVPFFLMREPGNALLQGVKASAVCLSAWGFALVTLQVAGDQFNPALGSWLPVVILLPITAALLVRIKT